MLLDMFLKRNCLVCLIRPSFPTAMMFDGEIVANPCHNYFVAVPLQSANLSVFAENVKLYYFVLFSMF